MLYIIRVEMGRGMNWEVVGKGWVCYVKEFEFEFELFIGRDIEGF